MIVAYWFRLDVATSHGRMHFSVTYKCCAQPPDNVMAAGDFNVGLMWNPFLVAHIDLNRAVMRLAITD